jgi:hypothetical protein
MKMPNFWRSGDMKEKEKAGQKKAYCAPRLKMHGDMRSITTKNPGGNSDNPGSTKSGQGVG